MREGWSKGKFSVIDSVLGEGLGGSGVRVREEEDPFLNSALLARCALSSPLGDYSALRGLALRAPLCGVQTRFASLSNRGSVLIGLGVARALRALGSPRGLTHARLSAHSPFGRRFAASKLASRVCRTEGFELQLGGAIYKNTGISRCVCIWRPLGDSNPCCRRERAVS